MTRRFFCLLTVCCCLWGPLLAQSSKAIRELENKRGELQRRIAESEAMLQTTSHDVGSQLKGLAALTGQIEERKRYIQTLNHDMQVIDGQLAGLGRQVVQLQKELEEKRERYAASVRYLQQHRSIQAKLMFVFSAQSLPQFYRRLRYVREYADYQRKQGEAIVQKQHQIDRKRNELLQLRETKGDLLRDRQQEQQVLEEREQEKAALVAELRRKQRDLQQELKRQRREAEQLNARIDQLIAEELEKARKRAEEEARREAAARQKKAEEAQRCQAEKSAAGQKGSAAAGGYALDKSDRQLSGSFASNRGKLPVPITGPYLVVSHYGHYTVLRNVVLDNKGIDLQGQPGAQARAVFGGKVAAVFQFNGLFNVLVRHGSYISVYCNLSHVLVKVGDNVAARQVLGDIFCDLTDGGRTVLHFQLRKETQKLNPEQWIAL